MPPFAGAVEYRRWRPRPGSGTIAPVDDEEATEAAAYLAMLRRHGRVLDTDDPDAPLPPGVTHVLVPGDAGPRLIERRKSAI